MSAPGELEYVPIGTNQHMTSKKGSLDRSGLTHVLRAWPGLTPRHVTVSEQHSALGTVSTINS